MYARGVDPFKWAKAFRRAAMHGAWEADDSACFATARQAMAGKRGGMADHFLRHRRELLDMYGGLMFGDQLGPEERRARMKRITTAYDMGASLDFWKRDNPEAEIDTLRGVGPVLVGLRQFSMEGYREELKGSAEWMAARAGSMMDFMGQPDARAAKRGKRAKRRRRNNCPDMTLKSYLLQEAEAVSREAKLAAAAVGGLRVVGLQHDGIALVGMRDGEEADVAGRLSAASTAACGYNTTVVVERVQMGGDGA